MRTRWATLAILAVLAIVALVSWPASAHHKPGHGGGTTTTTLPATTTTGAMPTTTTTTLGPCNGPLTINAGGSYSGCYESLNPATPAITISTTAPVTLDRVHVRHAGFGVFAQATIGTNLTVTNSTFSGLNPGSVISGHPALYLLSPASAVIEHNEFVNGHGLTINGDNLTTSPLRVKFNNYIDIGRWNSSTFIGAVHFDKVSAPDGAEVAWNRVRNRRGFSVAEDVIGLTQTNGASGFPVEVHHNLIDGAYPYTGDGASFTGGGIDLGDLGGSWQDAHDNTLVRCTNNGLMIPAGSNLHHHHNRVVCPGIADDAARVSSTFGAGGMCWDNPSEGYPPIVSSDLHDNVANLRRWNGSAWEFQHFYLPNCDPGTECTGGPQGFGPTNTAVSIGLTDDAAWEAEVADAIADWEAARVAAGVVVGPLP